MVAQQQQHYRVLMVTGVYPTPARPHKGTFIYSQAQSLVEEGHHVDVICPPYSLPMPLRYALASLQVFCKTLTSRYDIVHGHFGLWCLVARLQWTTAVVASFLGDDLLGEPLPDGSWSRRAALVVRLSRWLCCHVDAVIVKSEGMKQAAGFSSAFIIPNGVNFSLFHPIARRVAREELGWSQAKYYVLFGNNPQLAGKRYALAQAAVEQLRTRGMDVELVVAWGVPQKRIVLYMNACNAVILTSISEGSPNIVKEAMACNVPVVSVDVGDVTQVIGRTDGCVVCAADPVALADGLTTAFRHSDPTTGRTDIAHLEISVVARKVTAVYEHALYHKKLLRLRLLQR